MKRTKATKLYNVIENLRIPEGVDESLGKVRLHYLDIPALAFTYWPDFRPCLPINMYLLDMVGGWTGNTPVTFASELTHLIRYCASVRKGFDQLDDEDIYQFIEYLRNAFRYEDPTERVRNDNTIRNILHRVFSFLEWFQVSLYHGGAPIIGEQSCGALIAYETRFNYAEKKYYYSHRYMPQAISREPKMPIALKVIENIEEAIHERGRIDTYPESVVRRYRAVPGFLEAISDYLYQRRIFMIWMFKRTGLRPAELAALPLEENLDAFRTHVIRIPTLKRRKHKPPLRMFPISDKDGRKLLRYFSARRKWIDLCISRNLVPADPKSMFLATSAGRWGQAIGKGALVKDFEFICNIAGYRDEQVCFSMFRHRFITIEVLAHLRYLQGLKGQSLTDHELRSILERIRTKTGHGGIESLWHYIHLAERLGGVWDGIDQEIERLHGSDHVRQEIDELRRDFHRLFESGGPELSQIASQLSDRLNDIDQMAREFGIISE